MTEQKQSPIVLALRQLVASIYSACYGAYGSDESYQGQYEWEIQELAKAIEAAIKEQAGAK